MLIKTFTESFSKGSVNSISALVHIMACRRPSDKLLFEPMMVRSSMHMFVTRPQWVKYHDYLNEVFIAWGRLHQPPQDHGRKSLLTHVNFNNWKLKPFSKEVVGLGLA